MRATCLHPLSPQIVSALPGPVGIVCIGGVHAWGYGAVVRLGFACHCPEVFELV